MSAATTEPNIEDDVVTLRSALDYPKLGYGYRYREALKALDRLAEAAHASERLRSSPSPEPYHSVRSYDGAVDEALGK